jgi:hypothetical protein
VPTVLSAAVAAGCVLASTRRLALAVGPTTLEPGAVVVALRECRRQGRIDAPARLLAALGPADGADWERDLLTAVSERDEPARVALVNEQLRELDWQTQRWARVPRVCASVATSAGFLFGCVALIRGMGLDAGEAGDTAGLLVTALDALTVGIAGASFCIAVHLRASGIVRERLAATDRLVDTLSAWSAGSCAADAHTERVGP